MIRYFRPLYDNKLYRRRCGGCLGSVDVDVSVYNNLLIKDISEFLHNNLLINNIDDY